MNQSTTGPLPARWQIKGKKDRTKAAGAWICPQCGQRLATVAFSFCPVTPHRGIAKVSVAALVLPAGVDRKGATGGHRGPGPFYFGPDAHFEKTRRHAARQQVGQAEKRGFGALAGEERKVSDHERENLLKIKIQQAPLSSVHVVAEQLPFTVRCFRPDCNAVARIEEIAPPDVMAQLQQRFTASQSKTIRRLVRIKCDHPEIETFPYVERTKALRIGEVCRNENFV